LVVVLNHSILGFLPQYYGLVPSLASDNLQGSVLFVFFNGSAAVSLFFVLSGYILTRRYFASGDASNLMRGAVKRWPRLMGPVFVTTFVSYLLFYFHLYHFVEAGTKSGSHWLLLFADGYTRLFRPDATIHDIHFWTMLEQGTYGTFLREDSLFDSSLWTMHPELVGSFIAFGFAPLLFEARKSSVWAVLWLVFTALVILHYVWVYVAAFPLGVGMAALLPRDYKLRPVIAVPAILLALYLLGYPGSPIGIYRVFAWGAAQGMPYLYPQNAGAAILIGVIEVFPPIRRVFSGKISAFLGELSFPIYLLHVLVICSAGSVVYLHFGAIPAIISVFAISVLVSLPLIKFNNWWIAKVNRTAETLLRPRHSVEIREPRSAITPAAAGRNAPLDL
jgi:peptidoglycan/LPS O-acetylase OafA/YrhL